jgi:hypothetical protein
MLSKLQQWTRRFSIVALLVAIIVTVPAVASAQDDRGSSFAAAMFKGVFLDPTTYAPAIIAYDATMRDWNTSQPFFRNGYVERNERFTITGRPGDTPVSYSVGTRQIGKDAFANFGVSALTNAADRIFERALLDRFPNHRKLIRGLGWIERSAFASYWSYRLSAEHYRQASNNARIAAQLGLR